MFIPSYVGTFCGLISPSLSHYFLFWFIYFSNLLKEPIGYLGYIESKDRVIREKRIGKNSEVRGHIEITGSVPLLSWRILRIPRNTWVLSVFSPSTKFSPKKIQKRCRLCQFAVFVWNSYLICPLSSYNSIHPFVSRPLRLPSTRLFSIVTKHCGSRQPYRISRSKLDRTFADAYILTKRWRVMTSGVVISNFWHLLQSRETHDVCNCYLSLRQCLFTQMATRYLKWYASQVELYQNLNMFPPAQLNALWTQHLHHRQSKSIRLRVAFIYTSIHTRDKFWQ